MKRRNDVSERIRTVMSPTGDVYGYVSLKSDGSAFLFHQRLEEAQRAVTSMLRGDSRRKS